MHHQLHDLIAPVPGTARQIHSFHFGPQQPEGKVYIQSSLHADELPGMLVAWHLKARLAELETAGRLRSEIVLVPVANPVGLEQVLMDIPLGRYELESGQNFNRLFVDLSEDVGNQVEDLLGDDPQRNAQLIRSALSHALAAHTAQTQLHSQRLVLQRLACDADVVLDLQGLLKSAVLARSSGASRVIGFSSRYLRERLAHSPDGVGAVRLSRVFAWYSRGFASNQKRRHYPARLLLARERSVKQFYFVLREGVAPRVHP